MMANWETIKFNKKNYGLLIRYLYSLSNEKKQKFAEKIVNDQQRKILGIQTPVLKDLAKKIARGDWKGFIKFNTRKIADEVILEGLVLGFIKEPYEIVVNQLKKTIPFFSNWAAVDMTICNLKILDKNKDKALNLAQYFLKSNSIWGIRTGLIICLCYLIDSEHIKTVMQITLSIKSQEYYVKMANAWLISVCYVKFPKETTKLFETRKLDTWTQNKAIQKIRESFRVNKKDKQTILKYKLTV